MEDIWTEAQDARLSKAVIMHRFDFAKVASELAVSEEAARVRWTLLYCQQQGLPPPPVQQPTKPIEQPSKPVVKPAVKAEEQSRPQWRTAPDRPDFLDISDVDFSQQTSMSVTGEVITPSRFNIFDHSLKDTCDQIRMRAAQALPKMDFVLMGDEADEKVAKFRSRMIDNELIFERFDELADDWVRWEPIVQLPSMDDIKLIPDDYDPAHPTGKFAADVMNRTPAKIWETEPAKTEAPVYKEVTYKGTKTLVKASRSSSSSEEEDLEALNQARQRMRGRVMKDVPQTPLELLEDKPASLASIDLDTDTTLTPAYRNTIKRHEESQKEAFQLIKELQEKWRQEKEEELRLKAAERKAKEEIKQAEELRIQEEGNQKLQVERERKISAKLEEVQRKQQQARAREEEATESAKQAHQRQIEQEVRTRSEFNLFDRQTSFTARLPGISSIESAVTGQIIAAEVTDEAWEVLWYFARCSDFFGEIEADSEYFTLNGVLLTSCSSLSETLVISEEADARRVICLRLQSRPHNTRPLRNFLAGFPLNAIVGKSTPGKVYLSDLFTIVEAYSIGDSSHRAADLFSHNLSLFVVGPPESDFKFASVVIKPLSDVEETIQMTRELITQAQAAGLDVVGMRSVGVSGEMQDSVHQALNYTVPVGSSLAMCFYGPKAATVLGDVIGPDNPANARRHKPDSLHAKYPGHCAYFSINSAKAHRDTCYWFGGRHSAAPALPSVQMYPYQTCTIALAPEFSTADALSCFDWLLKRQFHLKSIIRSEISSEAAHYLRRRTPKEVSSLGVKTQAKAFIMLQIGRPNLWMHQEPIKAYLEQTSSAFTLLTDDEAEFLSVVDTSPIGCSVQQLVDYPALAYILLTPEAFKVEQGQLPALVFMSNLMKRVEVVGLKSLNHASQVDQLILQSSADEDLAEWVVTGLNLLVAVRALDVDSELEKAIVACKWQNKASSLFSKPLFMRSSLCSSFSLQELSSDPLSLKCPYSICPVQSAKFNDFLPIESYSVAVVRPERSYNLLKQFLRGLAKRDFEVVYAAGKVLSHKQIDLLYANSYDAAVLAGNDLDFDKFKVKAYGSSVVFKVRRVNAVQKLLEFAGDADPSKASSKSLRGAFGTTLEDNGLHCSASLAHAESEAELLCSTKDFGLLSPEDLDLTSESTCCVGLLTTTELSLFVETMLQEGFKLFNLRVDIFPSVMLSIYTEVGQHDAHWAQLIGNRTSVAIGFTCPSMKSASAVVTSLGLQRTLNVSRSSREAVQEFAIFFNEILK
jgi:nucleoside diphosphate kinase